MATEVHAKELVAAIRHDATKVIKDISKLSTQLRDAGLEHAEEVGTEVSRSILEEVNQLKRAQGDFKKAVFTRAKAVDGVVKSQPYAVIGGALGIGYLLGRLLSGKAPKGV